MTRIRSVVRGFRGLRGSGCLALAMLVSWSAGLAQAQSAPVVTTATLPSGVVGTPYSQTLAATGGVPPYTWSLASGTLPAGITLTSAGVVSGTPTIGVSTPVTFRATDVVGLPGVSAPITLTINQPTTTSLAVFPAGASVLGSGVTMQVTVTPNTASGKVTLYDGGAVLRTIGVSGSPVSAFSVFLPAGVRNLRAYYQGTTVNLPSTSNIVQKSIFPAPQSGFRTGVTFASGIGPSGMAAADFNGDGNRDVVTANDTAGSLSVFTGNGAGVLTAVLPTVAMGGSTLSVTTGDFNEDGIIDLAASCYTCTTPTVSVMIGRGDGTFSNRVDYTNGLGTQPGAILAGDYNNDGHIDLAVANNGSSSVSILLGNGAGTFGTGTTYAVATHPSGLVTGDFNGDGRMDLAVANFDAATVSVFLGQLGGTFGTAVNYATGGNQANSIASGDFNGDGFIDLVTANAGTNFVSVLLGTGSGTFGTGSQFAAGGTQFSVTVGDFNGDHVLDLIAANDSTNSYSVLPGNGTGGFGAPVSTSLSAAALGARAIIAGAFNADFISDVVISNFNSNTVSMLTGLQPSTTVLTSSVNPSVYNNSTALTATVSPASATGVVTFYDGAIQFDSVAPISGIATSYFSSSIIGLHSLIAVYSGDTNFGTSTSPAISQNVVLPTITIDTPSPLPAGLKDTPYFAGLSASGLTGESAFGLSAGKLPAGITLGFSSLSGTPTEAGTFNFTVAVLDQSGATASKAFSLTIYGPLSITGPFTISGVEGTPMTSTTLTQTGGAAPFTWTVLAGMPPGLTLNSTTGAVAGTPAAYGAYKTSIGLTDSIGSSTSATIDFVITPALTLSNGSVSNGSLRIPYQQQFYVFGGTGTGYVYTLSAGALPAGLTMKASTGLITGTPTVAGTFTFTVQVADSSAATTSKPFSMAIDSFGMLNFDFVTPAVPPYSGPGVVGSDFLNFWNPLDGTAPSAPIVSDDSGNTTNVTMNYSGAGTFDAGSNGFCLSETRYCNLLNGYLTALASTTATVNLGNLPAGSAWDLYFYTQTATTGSTLSVSVNGGTAITTTAVNAADSTFIAGKNYVVVPATVDAAGNVSVTFTSANGLDSYLNAFQAVPHVTPLTISTTSLLPGLVNANYSQTLLATNGASTPYVWTLTGGSLPTGLTLDGTSGTISGTATAAGSSPFTVTATDAYNFTATKAFSILIAQPISITTTTLLPGVVGATYNPALVASGGAGGNLWTLQSGSLPAGVTLTGGGSFSGAPSAAGTYTFTVRVTDASLNFATQALSLGVSPAVTVTTSALPVGELTSAYSQTVSALGGLGGYTYVVASGTLPSGITLNGSTGALSGTPLSAGTLNLVFRATDSGGNFGQSVSIPLTIQPAVTLTTTTLPAGTVGVGYNQTLAAANGVAPFTFSIATGTMPGGLTLSSGGTITGTPTTAGPFTVSFQVRDALTVQAIQTIGIQINAPLTISTTSIPNSTVGFPYSTQVVVTGGTGAGYVYALTGGALPGGVTLNTATGLISGSPTATGSFTPTIQVTDSGSATASQALPMTVRAFGTINTRWQGDPTTPYSGPGVVGIGGDSWNLFNQGLGSGLLRDSAAQPLPVGVTWTSDLVFNSGGRNAFCTSATPFCPLMNGYLGMLNGQTANINFGGLPPNTSWDMYLYQQLDLGGGRRIAVTVNGSTVGATTVDNSSTDSTFILNKNYLVVTATTDGSGNFNVAYHGTGSTPEANVNGIQLRPHQTALTISSVTLPDGRVGSAYAYTFTAAGGTGAGRTWSIASGSLPTGTAFDTTTGIISGTATVNGLYSFSVGVSDSGGNQVTAPFTIRVNLPVQILTSSIGPAVVGSVYNQTLAATGGVGVYTWTVSAGTLPGNITLLGGTLSGTPLATGSSTVTFLATDISGDSATRTLTLSVLAPVTVTTTTLTPGAVGEAYNQTIAAAGGLGGFTYSIASGTLPAGLTLTAGSGLISGAPAAAGSATLTFRATDSGGNFGVSSTIALNVNPALSITTTTLPTGLVGAAYSQTLNAADGVGAYTWTIAAGALPPGLNLSSGGAITGTPTTAGSYGVTFQVADAGAQKSSAFTIVVNGVLTLTTTTLPGGTAGIPYAQNLVSTGGSGVGRAFNISAGTLPAGLTLDATTGSIGGTPGAAGSSTFTVRVTDSSTQNATQSYTVAVSAFGLISLQFQGPGLNVQTGPASIGQAGDVWNQLVAPLGSLGSLTDGSGKPTGVSLTYSVPGTPASNPVASGFCVPTATPYCNLMQSFFTGTGPGNLSLSGFVPGSAWDLILYTQGDIPGITLSVDVNGAGPVATVGALNTDSRFIQGKNSLLIPATADAAGKLTLVLSTTTGPKFNINGLQLRPHLASLTITQTTAPAGLTGVPYGLQLTAGGGTGTGFVWSAIGSLPSGVTLDASTGLLAGTPTASGNFSFAAQVVDSQNNVGTQGFTLLIAPPITISTTTLPVGVSGTGYAQTLGGSGGLGSLTWSVFSGTLPPGLGLAPSTGVISGTPSSAGTSVVTFRATDAAANFASQTITMNIVAPVTTITTSLTTGAAGEPYSVTLTATGGFGSYTWSLASGALPAGLSLNPGTGLISGTPSGAASTALVFRATDTGNNSGTTASLPLVINAALTITTSALSDGVVGALYSLNLTTAGGTGTTRTWSISGGGLPAGLTMDAAGLISGTPTASGSFPVTVRVTNGVAAPTLALVLTVQPPVSVTTSSLPVAVQNSSYTQTLTAAGGLTGTYSWSITAGALPAGLTLSTGGLIAGASTVSGSFPITVKAADPAANFAIQPLVLTVNLPLTITSSAPPVGAVGQNYTYTLTSQGGTGVNTWSMTGSPTAGLTFDAASHTLSGTPTASGTVTLTFDVTDSNNNTASKIVSLQVNSALTVTTTSLPSGVVGIFYDQTIGVTGGIGARTFTVKQGALPAGLTIDQTTGRISGTPTATTTSLFTITVADSGTGVASLPFSLTTVAPLVITSGTLPDAVQGIGYSATLTTTGGLGTITWSLNSGTPPAGLTLSPGGVLDGTPTAAGSLVTLNVRATDTAGNFANGDLSVLVKPPVTFTTLTLPNAVQGASYNQVIGVTGGFQQYTFSVSAGQLPTGVTLSPGGTLSGTPAASGTYNFTVKVADLSTSQASQPLTIIVNDALVITTTTIPPAIQGAFYSQPLVASGGTGSIAWSFPTDTTASQAGFSIDPVSGVLSGTPSTFGALSLKVKAQDTQGNNFVQTFSLPIARQQPGSFDLVISNTVSGALARMGSDGSNPLTLCSGAPCHPGNIAADAQGNIYSHDTTGIYKITPGGVVSTILQRTGGVGGIIADAAGNAIFGDNASDTIYKVTPAGVLTTVAPLPQLSPANLQDLHVALDRNGDYIVGSGHSSAVTLYRFTPAGAVTTLATFPGDGISALTVATDGTIRYLDYRNGELVTFDPNGAANNSVSTVLPTGETVYIGLAVDPANGDSILAGRSGNSVNRVTLNGAITNLITGTPISGPTSIAAVPVLAPLTVSTTSLPSSLAGQVYGPVTLQATGGSGNFNWAATGLPPNFQLSTAGALSGSPAAPGTFNVVITVSDLLTSATATQTFTLLIAPPITISTTTLPAGVVGTGYGQTLGGSGGLGGLTWSVFSGSLPPGLGLAPSTGSISGNPSLAGSSVVTFRATDAAANFASQSITINIVAPVTTTVTPLPTGAVGEPYSVTLTATGGFGSYTWSLASGALPAGLSLNPGTGLISGPPSGAASTALVFRATDTGNNSGTTASLPLVINPGLTITTSALNDGVVGAVYSLNLTTAGGTGTTRTWSVAGGGLPAGLTLDSAGLISGTPTAFGSFPVTIRVTNGVAAPTLALVLTVQPSVSVTISSLPVAVQNSSYTQTLTAAGGLTGTYSWSITAGALPAGVTLSAGGLLSGTPTLSGSFPITVKAADPAANFAIQPLVLTVNLPLTITSSAPPVGAMGQSYSYTLTSQGGTGVNTWSLTGTPVAGLTFNAGSHTLSGTPTASGTVTLTFDVTDSNSNTASKIVSLQVNTALTITTTSLPSGVIGIFYDQTIGVTGGIGARIFTVNQGVLPAGLTIDQTTGRISGKPTQATTNLFNITVTDSGAGGVSVPFSLTTVAPLVITSGALPDAVQGIGYSASLTTTGGLGTIIWSLNSGVPPAGLTLSSGGVLGGTPTATGPLVALNVKATDTAGSFANGDVSVLVKPPVAFTTLSLPNAVQGASYTPMIGITGGFQQYTFSVSAGQLPTGLTLSAAGVFSGTPSASGTYNFTVNVLDTSTSQASQQFTVVVNNSVLITTTTIQPATQGTPYSQPLKVAGGIGAITWSFPTDTTATQAGFAIDPASGLLSGTPTTFGTLNLKVKAQDTQGNNFIQTFSLPIARRLPGSYDFVISNTESGRLTRMGSDGSNPLTVCSGSNCHIGDIATDAQGNVYSHDTTGVYKTTPGGLVTTILSRAGGAGGIVVDAVGSAIFGDNLSDTIYKVTPAGVLTTVAALPQLSPTNLQDLHLALDNNGDYIVASDHSNAVTLYRFTPARVVTTLATFPGDGVSALAVAGDGTIRYVDYRHGELVTFDPNGESNTSVSTVLPAGETVYIGLAIDPANGDSIVAESYGNTVFRVTQNGAITTLIRGIPISGPSSIAVVPVLGPLTISTPSLPSSLVGQAYGPVTLQAKGGSGRFTWSATGLPPNFQLSTAGSLSGSPTSSGTFTVTISVTDGLTGSGATTNLAITISTGVAPLSMSSSASQANIALGGSVSATFAAAGGNPPYTFTASGMPLGIGINASGVLSGSPTAPGNFNGTVFVSDTLGRSASAPFTITVLGMNLSSFPVGQVGTPYSASVTAVGGLQPYSFAAAGLPAGISLGGTGLIGGTPTAPGNFSVSIVITDGGGAKVSASVTLSVLSVSAPVSIPSGTLTGATVNTQYSASFGAIGGKSPYTWSLISSSLPDGLALATSGVVSGNPTTPGTFSFGVLVTDSAGGTASTAASIVVKPEPLVITSKSPLPQGMRLVEYPATQLAVTGGIAPYKWSLASGALPAGMTFSENGGLAGIPTQEGSFTAQITVTDTAAVKTTAEFALQIRPTTADLMLSSSAVSFSLTPGADSVPGAQTVTVQSTQVETQILYSVAVTPAVSWLTVTSGSKTPDSNIITLNAGALSLPPGEYVTTVRAICGSGSCAGLAQTIAVTLSVTSPPARLKLANDLISFVTTARELAPLSQSLTLQNIGGGSLGVASVTCQASWCTASAPPSTVPGGGSASVGITVDPAAVVSGFQRTTVEVNTSAGRASVPVTLFIAANSGLALSPTGGQFVMPVGGAPGNGSGSFLVSVNSTSSITLTPSLVPGAAWLRLNTATVSASSNSPGTVSYSIDAAAASTLAAGAYYGQIAVSGPGVINSPQSHQVILNVTPASEGPRPDPQPAGLLFLSNIGGPNPPRQLVTLYTSASLPTQYQTSAESNGSWLSVTPATGLTSQPAPASTTVTANIAGLKPGVYVGLVNYAFGGAGVRSVNVTLVVSPVAGTAPTLTTGAPAKPREVCSGTVLAPVQTGIVTNFSAPAAWPTPLSIKLVDDCGNFVTTGQVVTTFSNGDAPLALPLVDPKNGLYAGTWTPRKTSSTITIKARISAKGYPDLITQLQGSVTPNAAPVLTPHGIVHAFAPLIGAPLAPGNIVAVYGSNLAVLTGVPTAIPLPTSVNGTQVLIGGVRAPLYFTSPGQVNAQIPYELEPNRPYQVIISANGALSTPDDIQISPVVPGVAAYASGTVIAQHADGSLIDEKSPARGGEIAIAYLSGLGDTDNDVASGGASPGDVLARPLVVPTLSIGGREAKISFVGLTPGLVGLYQMNFEVPQALPEGNPKMVVTQSGAPSNPVLLPYVP